MIIHGDCLEVMKTLEPDSVDTVITDPPYGYSFMGKDWDKAVPSVDTWKECLRVLKPGAFACVMSAPRSDVQMHMIQNLTEAGFRLDFTPIYWTYASGFPKAGNIGKLVDKRLGAEREVVSSYERSGRSGGILGKETTITRNIDKPKSDQAKALDGSYAGFQPKPAVEVIIIAMKPLSEKTFVDQALKNGKGISWLDDCRVPTNGEVVSRDFGKQKDGTGGEHIAQLKKTRDGKRENTTGRFPANLLVSDDVLNDGRVTQSHGGGTGSGKPMDWGLKSTVVSEFKDSGSYSRYFDLDKWATTLPFLIVPKASKSEKNKGLDGFMESKASKWNGTEGHRGVGDYYPDGSPRPNKIGKNHHPTVKPLKLMSYLVTLFSREGDTVLDPFLGSGTTALAAKKLGRKYIGIELNKEYVEIAQARLDDKQEALF